MIAIRCHHAFDQRELRKFDITSAAYLWRRSRRCDAVRLLANRGAIHTSGSGAGVPAAGCRGATMTARVASKSAMDWRRLAMTSGPLSRNVSRGVLAESYSPHRIRTIHVPRRPPAGKRPAE